MARSILQLTFIQRQWCAAQNTANVSRGILKVRGQSIWRLNSECRSNGYMSPSEEEAEISGVPVVTILRNPQPHLAVVAVDLNDVLAVLSLTLKRQKLCDFIGDLFAARGVHEKPQIGRIDRLKPEKLKGQFADTRMINRFAPFQHIEHIGTCP